MEVYVALPNIPTVRHVETRTLWPIYELGSSGQSKENRTSLKLLSQPVRPHACVLSLGDGGEELRVAERVSWRLI